MRRITLLMGLMLTVTVGSLAQDYDDTTQYSMGIPVDPDTVQNFPQEDFYPKKDQAEVDKYKIPKRLARRLRKEEQYRGWDKLPVYFDRNTKMYIVRTRHNGTIKVFGLNDRGNLLTYDEYDEDVNQ